MSKQNVRDTFWRYVYEQAKLDHNVVIVSADLGAMSLDAFRDEMPSQFISVGIAEQFAIEAAAGLALGGKKVYVYACEPFIFMRCYEQIKLCVADTNLPITVVGQGMGVCYSESGATHHTLEDIGALRMLPRLNVLTPSDEFSALEIAKYSYQSKGPLYVRLDRPMPNKLYDSFLVEQGYGLVNEGNDRLVISSGQMLHEIVEQVKKQEKGTQIGIIDLFSTKPDDKKLADVMSKYSDIIVVEEHAAVGGIGSMLLEINNRYALGKQIKIHALNSEDGYIHKYGSRKHMWDLYGVDIERIVSDL